MMSRADFVNFFRTKSWTVICKLRAASVLRLLLSPGKLQAAERAKAVHGRGRSAGIPGKQQVRAKINYILMSDLKKQAIRITPGPNPQNIIDFGRELALTVSIWLVADFIAQNFQFSIYFYLM